MNTDAESTELTRLREAVCRLYRSLNGICKWTHCAQEHLPPFGNNYRGAIDCVHTEAESALAANSEFAAEAMKGVVND